MLNDTTEPMLVLCFTTYALFSFSGAMFWLVIGGLEAAAYVITMMVLHGGPDIT